MRLPPSYELFFRSWNKSVSLRRGLLAATALLSIPALSSPVLAQVIIDGGATETVPSGAHPSPWNTLGDLTVGLNGNGTLDIQAGGTVNLGGHQVYLGDTASALGTVTVSGTGAILAGVQLLSVGNLGEGVLTISNGGFVDSVGGTIGVGTLGNSSATGTLTVTDAGSLWTTTSDMQIGSFGTGTLNILNGGAVITGANAYIGDTTIGTGVVDISGTGSSWTTNDLTVGHQGAGTLTVEAGGSLASDNTRIGALGSQGGDVTVTGAGSTWNNSGTLAIGGLASGTLTIAAGGVVTSGTSTIGGSTSTSSQASVSDANSIWNTAALYVGGNTSTAGNGNLLISTGGVVNSTGGYMALLANSVGTATVTGAGATWTLTDALVVGMAGNATLTISGGATVSNSSSTGANTYIGGGPGTGTAIVTGAGSSWTINGDLLIAAGGFQSAGSLTVSDGASVTTTETAYIGYGNGSMASAVVFGPGSSWTVGSDLYVGGFGAFSALGALTVADGATVTVNNGNGTIYVAQGPGYVSTLTIGSQNALVPFAPGTINAATVYLGADTGQLYFNHTSSGYDFAPVIAGGGQIFQLAGVTNLTGDSSGFAGTTEVQGGTLSVNGALGGAVSVFSGATLSVNGTAGGDVSLLSGARLSVSGTVGGNVSALSGALVSVNGAVGGTVSLFSGATLMGNGTVGPTSVAQSATIAPGNSIGTLTVAGDLSLAAGSIYAVEINSAGQSDLLKVTGGSTLTGADVTLTKAPGNYLPGMQYTILTAAGGITGTFGSFTQDMPFLDLALSYDPNDVYLTIARNEVAFPDVAVTPNQIATATAVEALGQGNTIYNAIVSQTNVATAQQAFNLLDGEVYPSAMSVLQNESLFLRRAVLDRTRVSATPSAPAPLAYATKAPAGPFGTEAVAAPGAPNAFWAQGFGAWGQIDGNGNAATISGNTSGVFVGYDRTFSPGAGDWRVGFAAGYSSSSYQIDARSSSFSSDNAHVAVYGGGTFGALGLRFGAAYSWADISTSRNVVFPGFSNALAGDTSARTGQVFGEVGYGLSFASVDVEPFAGLAYVNVDMNDVTEAGGPAALTSYGGSQGVTYSTLGARVSAPLALGTVATSLKGSLAWQHTFGGTTPETLFSFGAGTQPFTISGVPIASDAALVEAGLDMAFTPTAMLSVFYAGHLAESDTNNMIKGNFTLRF